MDIAENTRDCISKKLLLADDNADLRALLCDIFVTCGHQVTCAENGRQALDLFLLSPEAFDLLITDIYMPQMNGEELIHHVRMINNTLPIIAITGYADELSITNIQSHCVELLYKPLNIAALTQLIDSL